MAFVSQWLGNQPSLIQNYLNSPWSFFARNLRGANADFTGVNYATFFYTTPNPLGGGMVNLQMTQASNQYHSEKEVWMAMRNQGSFGRMDIPNWRTGELPVGMGVLRLNPAGVAGVDGSTILAVYTERQPCGTCSPFLDDVLPNGTIVAWHFPWGSKETKKFKHKDDDIGAYGLMALSQGKSYDQSLKDHQRDYRVEGNKDLKGAMKGMQTSTLSLTTLTKVSPLLIRSGDDMLID
jgi:hypothetical protein